MRLVPHQAIALEPEDAFRIGQLEFLVQRFNTAVCQDMGQRDHMEDAFQIIQDIKLSPEIKMSYFGVFDGHGGDCCALFLRKNLHVQLTQSLAKLQTR